MRNIRLLALVAAFSLPLAATGGEVCSQMSGVCRDACGPGEAPEQGAFMDCGEKQECCVKKEDPPPPKEQAAQGAMENQQAGK